MILQLTGAVLLLATATVARAEEGMMPLDHTTFLYKLQDPMLGPMDAEGLPGGKYTATSHSRGEIEGKVATSDGDHHARMLIGLHQLAADAALMEKVVGKGSHLAFTRKADYGDEYMDAVSRVLAKASAGARRRVVNGKDLELNIKPGGGILSGPGGIILSRDEHGMPLGPNADLAALAHAESPWNPILKLRHLYKGDLADLMVPSVALNTKRERFVYGVSGRETGWDALVDFSADHVYSMKDVHPSSKKIVVAKPEDIFGLEADLNHPGSEAGMAVKGVAWKAPHTSLDMHRPELHADPAVMELHRAFPLMLNWLSDKHRVDFTAARTKYTQAAINMGLITAKQVKPIARR